MAAHERALIHYAWRMTGNLEQARDVVQDTFLRACQADQGDLAGREAPWLYRVCRNRTLDVLKKEQRMQTLEPNQAEARPSPGPSPAEAASENETGRQLQAAMEHLDEKQAEVFRLKFQHQMSYKEISEVTGFPVNNVRYLIHTALKVLREQLRGQVNLAAQL
ncbi:MAG: sigma-70 family RNA polymerase sigma factor [Candidatus Hydrogenedentes bacterium]|nr:sigma-70 family RNA polymerase sigma factor [Candidatus Hydrogenedentota bacterium]